MQPEPTHILAVRHGETAWNVDARLQGQLDVGLNATGQWQARQVAQALAGEGIAGVYSSDLCRAFDTAQAIATACGLTPQTHTGLRERHFGEFQGHTYKAIELNWPQQSLRWRQRDPDFAPAGGESLAQLHERVGSALQSIALHHAGEQIVLVTHGGVLDILHRLATGLSLQAARTWSLGNAAINRLLWTPHSLTVVGWSDTTHLQTDQLLDEASA